MNNNAAKVLHVVTRLGLGGAESVAVSLARGLKTTFPSALYAVRGVQRNEVGAGMKRLLQEQGIPLFSGPAWPLKAGGMIPAALALQIAIRNFRPEIVHLHTEIPEATFATLAAFVSSTDRVRLVRTIHHSAFWSFWPRLGAWCERRLHRSFVAGVSNDALEGFQVHLRRAGSTGPKTVRLVYNGVQTPGGPRTLMRAEGTPIRVLYAGRLDWDKGTDLLPEILRLTKPPEGGATLTIYGEGRQRRSLQRQMRHGFPGWKVTMLPPTPLMAKAFDEHELLIMPSRVEGLGLVAIEASLHRLPVVGTNALGLREALPPDHPWMPTAADPRAFSEALSDALSRPEKRRTTADRAADFARGRFSPKVMLAEYSEIYRATGASPCASNSQE